MTKRCRFLAALVAAAGLLVPATVFARTVSGHVTTFSPTSISVFDREIVTVGMNGGTAFTKLVVQKPWQENTRLTFSALTLGRYVVVHADNGVATWVQVNMNRPAYAADVFTFEPRAAPLTFSAAIAQSNPADILSGKDVRDLIANAKTPAEHRKLAKHFAAVAARYDADAVDHVAEAKAYRSAPNAAESKRPGSPDTAVHCDRLADAARNAATAARELARDHEQMAK